jgi:hypothetical protein
MTHYHIPDIFNFIVTHANMALPIWNLWNQVDPKGSGAGV